MDLENQQADLGPRLAYVAREALASPPGAAAGAAALALLAAAPRSRFARALAQATGLGLVTWRAAQLLAEVDRTARNAADAPVVTAWLGASAQPLGAWSIEPDFGRLAVDLARQGSGSVVELGSGASTVVIARHLERAGTGHLITIDHDKQFADETRRLLEREGLADHATVVDAPLAEQAVGTERVTWYDQDAVLGAVPDSIDTLIVDGPPATVPWARWAAVELLGSRIKPGGTVLLDDGRREMETATAYRWAEEHPEFDLFWFDTVKGSWMLRRNAGPRPRGTSQQLLRNARKRFNPHPVGFGRWPVGR